MGREVPATPGPRDAGPDLARLGVAVLAGVFVPVAALTEPSSWWLVLALALAALTLVVWALLDVPVVLVAVPVVVLTVVSQWEGGLEPGLFLLSLLGIVLTGWSELSRTTVLLVLLTLAAPLVVAAVQGGSGISPGIWVLGILFPALMGWAYHRQERMGAELEAARIALAEQAVQDERRRIARDVHDQVGHGLAAMMLQVTGARHVLDDDPAEAREALSAAEDVGRRTLRDLRRTVGALRDDEGGLPAPLEGLAQVGGLVEDARAGGLDAEYVARGPQDVDQTIGLTFFRIAQAALANAAIHAPSARTVVTSTVTDEEATLDVLSSGPLRAPDPDERRRHYGLVGMRERAAVVGGEFSAGPVPGGWLVRCRVAR